ncbi:MAG: outer membrane protein transport protein [Deltaproteobacteria bacterium]|nr:outer membrane protein transport protein [Deltaproteobacteria bacterium]
MVWKVQNARPVCAAGVVAAAVLAAVPETAFAAGAEYPDNGTIAIGRGCAWAANPSDGLAFQYNPAGLAQQRGLRLYADARLAKQNVRFTSTSIKGDPIENSADAFLGPSGALTYGVGPAGPLSELTFALGATGPSAIGIVNYPHKGVQRYALTETDYFIGYYSASVAAGWGDWLRVGVTGQLAHGSAKFSQAVFSGEYPGTEPEKDSYATFEGSNTVLPTGVLGLTVLPRPDLAIGLSWRPAMDFAADGTLKTEVPEWAKANAKQVGDQAQLQLKFADVVRLGVQYKPSTRWDIELDAVYERWSVLKEVRVHTKNVTVVPSFAPAKPVKVDDIVFPHDYKDTWSVRLGGDYQAITDRLALRGGYLYESNAAPSKTVSVDFPNWSRHVASVGASVRAFGAWIDLAYAHHFVDTQVVTDSVVVQQTTPQILPGFDPVKPAVVGNGTYEASMDILSLSLRVPFGDLSGNL